VFAVLDSKRDVLWKTVFAASDLFSSFDVALGQELGHPGGGTWSMKANVAYIKTTGAVEDLPDVPDKKSTLEDELRANLSGDLQKGALDFTAFMGNKNFMEYLGEKICNVHYHRDFYGVYFGDNDSVVAKVFEDFPIDDGLREFLLAHLNKCSGCGCGKQPGVTFTLFGKAYEKLCGAPFAFQNPDPEEFGKIKELAEVWKRRLDVVVSDEKKAELAEEQRRIEESDKLRDVFIEKLNGRKYKGEPVSIDLCNMVKDKKFEVTTYYDGTLKMSNDGNSGRMKTHELFNAPLKMEMRVKRNYSGWAVELGFNKSRVYLRRDGTLFLHDLMTAKKYEFPDIGEIPTDEFFDLELVIDREFIAVKIDGELRFIGNNFAYVDEYRKNPDYSSLESSVYFTAKFGSTITVASLRVTEIA
jgi:hypothetical protein